MNEMEKQRKKFNELSDDFDKKVMHSETEVWSLLLSRQAVMFDALMVLFNEIQLMKIVSSG